jgi:hypothetical protein
MYLKSLTSTFVGKYATFDLLSLAYEECEAGYNRGTCTPMFIAALFTIASFGNN